MNPAQVIQFAKVKQMLHGSLAASVPSEDELRQTLHVLASAFGGDLSVDHVAQIFDEVAKLRSINMDKGVVVQASDHKPWLAESGVEWRLWKAYSQWLINQGRSPLVVDQTRQSLDIILDRLGNPADAGAWSRRGLVIGDVQSGKTGTYIGLMDKAADAGYRVFVLLTGNTEALRQQTQSRVDQGVIGRDSMSQVRNRLEPTNKPKAVGIGKMLEDTSNAFNMTTMLTDFRKNSAQAVDFNLGPDHIVVFVTKKNKTVLDRIAEWLAQQDNVHGQIQQPFLLLDDESDYASINTRNPDESPTAINAGIRRLLGLFSRSSYVGFTATPFANIFIDDEQPEDLFPKDFIYGLEAPSNYVGPQSIFGTDRPDDEDESFRLLEDAEEYFPVKHKSGFAISGLPESLLECLRTFLIANAIRDLRKQQGQPRAMLVNVSRYTRVQSQVFEAITAKLAVYRNAIQLHAASYAVGDANEDLRALERTFRAEYASSGFLWQEVLEALPAAVADIQTRLVNSKTDKKLEQDELSAEAPPRVIAVGGDLLSRGLTLEGLTVSYFYRHTAASDTLMQMGRWFGYRENYGDLCRLWIDSDMAAAYSHAADSLDELGLELKRMRDQKLTPEQYGLAVRNHPGALLITARNKMKAAAIGQKQISMRGRSIESYKLSSQPHIVSNNLSAARGLAETLEGKYGPATDARKGRPIWRSVDKAHVAEFLGEFRAHESQGLFDRLALARFAKSAVADDLQTWDVIFMGGGGSTYDISSTSLSLPQRRTYPSAGEAAWLVGAKQRVAGPGDVASSLAVDVVDQIKTAFLTDKPKGTTVPDSQYVSILERPALLVYLVEALDEGKNALLGEPLVAVKIAIPGGAHDVVYRREDDVTYTLNSVAQRLLNPELADSTLEDDDDV